MAKSKKNIVINNKSEFKKQKTIVASSEVSLKTIIELGLPDPTKLKFSIPGLDINYKKFCETLYEIEPGKSITVDTDFINIHNIEEASTNEARICLLMALARIDMAEIENILEKYSIIEDSEEEREEESLNTVCFIIEKMKSFLYTKDYKSLTDKLTKKENIIKLEGNVGGFVSMYYGLEVVTFSKKWAVVLFHGDPSEDLPQMHFPHVLGFACKDSIVGNVSSILKQSDGDYRPMGGGNDIISIGSKGKSLISSWVIPSEDEDEDE